MVESALDQVSGLGEIRRKALVGHFGSMKKLRAASVTEVAQVPGIGPRLAETIVTTLAERPRSEVVNTATGEVTEV